jgi:3-dehydroquinate synthase
MRQIDIRSRQHDYQVRIECGLLSRLNEHLDAKRSTVILTDTGVPVRYLEQVKTVVPDALVLRVDQGEESKSLSTFEHIVERLLRANIKKDAVLICLGGGVVGDLGGYVAASYLRGIDFIQIPTTLLAQIDSSVGGKVAVNTKLAKNAIGHVWPPRLVLVDPDTLQTLPVRQLNNGFAEMIKIAATADSALFEQLKEKTILDHMEEAIARSIELKKQFVEADEFDQSVRQILNFGHTFGHAIEAYYHYDKYLHGEAVAIGMVRIASRPAVKEELRTVLTRYDLPVFDPVSDEALLELILRDKKGRAKELRIIDVPKIGTSEFRTFPLPIGKEEA